MGINSKSNIIMAELLDMHEVERPFHEDHAAFFAGRIATSGGVIRFIQEGANGLENQYFFVGGLISGCAYDMPACETAQTDASSTLIRHANTGYSEDVLAIDAAEIAEAIEVRYDGGAVHIVAHSKGTKVALMAAQMLDSGIELASVILDNPVLGVGINRHNIVRRLRRLPSVATSMGSSMLRPRWTHVNAQKASQKEIIKRAPAIMAETKALLFGGQGITRKDVEQVQDRRGSTGTVVIMGYGNNDHITHADDIEVAMDQEGISFDSVLKFTEPGENDHLAIINNPVVIQKLLRRERQVLGRTRKLAA